MTQAHESVSDRHDRHAYERMIVLSDGVFAIAVTLLALELHPTGAVGTDWRALLNALAPKLMAYAISFMVVAIFWIAQRRSFARYVRVDAVLVWLTLAFLGLVSLIPAATDMAYAINGPGPAVLFIGLIVLISLVQAIGWGYAAFIGKLVAPDVTPAQRLYLFAVSFLAPSLFSAVSLYGVTQHGRMTEWSWVLLAVMIVGLRFASRWVFKPTAEKASSAP